MATTKPTDNENGLALQGFKGLSLKVDFANRAKESFQTLDNVDLYIPGSLRKVLPALLYGGPYGANILNCIEYLAQPNGPNGGIRRLIGIGADGKLYNLASATPAVPYLDTSALLGVPTTVPYMLQQSGFFVPFNVRSWQKATIFAQFDAVLQQSPSDGNLYVFYASTGGTSHATNTPNWPKTGTVIDNTVVWTNAGLPNSTAFLANFLCIITPGKQPIRVVEWQYNPASLTEMPKYTQGQMGISPPELPIQIGGQTTTPNLNGYAPVAGRAYLWTLFNPQTLKESSPAPFVGQTKVIESDNGYAVATINGSVLLPLPSANTPTKFSSYQSYYLAIGAFTVLNPVVGQGYTHIKIYATKDGGTQFFLVTTLYDNLGNQISNADGSVPISLLSSLQIANNWLDYVPVPGTAQPKQQTYRLYEGSGPVNFAPDPTNLSAAAWTFINVGTTPLYVATGAAPDGNNAFAYDGTGAAAAGPWRVNSFAIAVQPSTVYYFQGFIDNTGGTGGTVAWRIVKPNGTVVLSLAQANNTSGTVSGTFTTGPNDKNVIIQCYLTGATVTTGNTDVWADPVLQLGSTLNTTPTNYPTPDQSLTIPAPAVFTNYPPPIAMAAEVIFDSLILVDFTDQTKIWYSQQGLFEQFGANAFVRTTVTKNADQILELIKCFDRLLVCKGRSIEQITTYPPQQPITVDPQHGVLAKRSSITWGTSILSLLTDGLGQVQLAAEVIENKLNVGLAAELFGDDIKPLVDSIKPSTLRANNLGPQLPCPTIFNKQDLFMLAYQVGNNYNDNVLMYYLGRSRGFSRLTAMPNGQNIITLKEVQTPSGGTGAWPLAGNGDYAMLALTTDAKSYVLFTGTQDGTITATVVTQPLPTTGDVSPEIWDSDKHFSDLWVEGQDLSNWLVYAATEQTFNADGTVASYPWGPFNIRNNEVDLGIHGKQIVLKFVHSAASAVGVTPLLTYFSLSYSIKGRLN